VCVLYGGNQSYLWFCNDEMYDWRPTFGGVVA
jgi:hypothetical protein